MRLAVELHGTLLGHLEGSDSRTADFHPSEEGIAAFGVGSRVLSVAIPLTPVLPRHHAARRRTWFVELMPEGDQLEYMLAQAAVRRGDILGFLAHYGRDIAGAVQLWDVDDPTEPRTPGLEAVDRTGIRRLLEEPQVAPLGNEVRVGKTSLAGVQPKIVLARVQGSWNRVIGGYPSTHILKPRVSARPTSIYDEEYGSRLARSLGLLDYATDIVDFDGLDALVVERFDREGEVTLAPAYDVVPMTHLSGVDGRLALAVGGEYLHGRVTVEHLESELTRWGLRRSRALVESTLEELRSAALREEPLAGAHGGLADDVVRFATNLLDGRAAGESAGQDARSR